MTVFLCGKDSMFKTTCSDMDLNMHLFFVIVIVGNEITHSTEMMLRITMSLCNIAVIT